MASTPRKRLPLLLLPLALVLAFAFGSGGVQAQTAGIPSVGVQFDLPGSYAVTVTPAANHTYYHPTTMGAGGVDHPVILWGNGTGVTNDVYSGLLRHYASQGFIVAAANTTNSGTGREMLAGLDELTRMNADPASTFSGKVDLTRVGSTGHSQGGGGAIEAAADPRVDTTFPMQPYRGTVANIRGSAFFMSGQNDTTIPPITVLSKYQAASSKPAVYGELAGATHFIPAGAGGGYRYAATAWARLELMDDEMAKLAFFGDSCVLCQSAEWSDFQVNALAQRSPK